MNALDFQGTNRALDGAGTLRLVAEVFQLEMSFAELFYILALVEVLSGAIICFRTLVARVPVSARDENRVDLCVSADFAGLFAFEFALLGDSGLLGRFFLQFLLEVRSLKLINKNFVLKFRNLLLYLV